MPACLLACLPASWPLFCAGPRRRRRCPSDSVHSCHVSRARLLARYSGQTLWGHTVQAWLKDLLGPHWGAARRWRSFPRTRCPSVLLRVRHVNCTEPPDRIHHRIVFCNRPRHTHWLVQLAPIGKKKTRLPCAQKPDKIRLSGCSLLYWYWYSTYS